MCQRERNIDEDGHSTGDVDPERLVLSAVFVVAILLFSLIPAMVFLAEPQQMGGSPQDQGQMPGGLPTDGGGAPVGGTSGPPGGSLGIDEGILIGSIDQDQYLPET